mmetsp:Transcript_42027/g.129879  ORF Transcript_42027/g.129879 Transcript_42027/m.129879 type:complete len:203 (-) Transcript_42027:537-1145(-)
MAARPQRSSALRSARACAQSWPSPASREASKWLTSLALEDAERCCRPRLTATATRSSFAWRANNRASRKRNRVESAARYRASICSTRVSRTSSSSSSSRSRSIASPRSFAIARRVAATTAAGSGIAGDGSNDGDEPCARTTLPAAAVCGGGVRVRLSKAAPCPWRLLSAALAVLKLLSHVRSGVHARVRIGGELAARRAEGW